MSKSAPAPKRLPFGTSSFTTAVASIRNISTELDDRRKGGGRLGVDREMFIHAARALRSVANGFQMWLCLEHFGYCQNEVPPGLAIVPPHAEPPPPKADG